MDGWWPWLPREEPENTRPGFGSGLEKIAAAVTADDSAGLNAAGDVLVLAVLVTKARELAARRPSTDAIALLTEASAKEDSLAYDEPSDWFFPVPAICSAPRCCGPARPRRRKRVPVEDLRRHPDNGWALYGLAQSLSAQHKEADARMARLRFDKAWQSADITLTASAF